MTDLPEGVIPGAHGGGKLRPWKPGQSGNPAGRKAAGASVKEWINSMFHHNVKESELRRIANDPGEPVTKRTAARRMLRMISRPDMADFQPWIDGEKTLSQLEKEGIDLDAIKCTTEKVVSRGWGRDVRRSIELRDMSLKEFEKLLKEEHRDVIH